MDPHIIKKLEEQDAKLEAIYTSVEKTRVYFKWTLIITIIVLVLPLILMVFAAPSFIGVYTDMSAVTGY